MVVSIGGQRMYMWRAVDSEGEVLEVLIQRTRDKAAALVSDEASDANVLIMSSSSANDTCATFSSLPCGIIATLAHPCL